MFILKDWDSICEKVKESGYPCITAARLVESSSLGQFVILKHDVETSPQKALQLAFIENKYGLHGTYYIQAYLLGKRGNLKILDKLRSMGHEVTYHHDVLDACKGNFEAAIEEFRKNVLTFESNGFKITTVCQHGNPIIKREGYYSNRDFFRSERITKLFPAIVDVAVNFREKTGRDFRYISDSGYSWMEIPDMEYNDLPDARPAIPVKGIDDIFSILNKGDSLILSVHPHRWMGSEFESRAKKFVFRFAKIIAKLAMKIRPLNKIMERFYYLAKKI